MEEDLSQGLHILRTSGEVWDMIKVLYVDKNHMGWIYHLYLNIGSLSRGHKRALVYTKLKSLWQELSFLEDVQFHFTKYVEDQKKRVEIRRISEFWPGLNEEFEPGISQFV